MKITIPPCGGLIPKLESHLLPEGAATDATNVDLRRGSLRPALGPGATVGAGGDTIYLDGATWRTWATDVDVVRSNVSATRIIYTDGVLPKIRDGATEYPLGIPAPTAALVATAQAKTASAFTLAWHWFYEEPDGRRVDVDLSAIAPTVTTIGVTYTLAAASIPAKVSASVDARFIMWAELTGLDGAALGKVVPSPCLTQASSDAVYAGATITGALVIAPNAVLTLSYDTSRISDYEPKRSYVYTYLRRWPSGGDDEGPPSPVSLETTVNPSQDCNLTSLPTAPTGYGITHLRIYRTVTGAAGTQTRYVTEKTNGTASHLDSATDAVIGLNEEITTTDYDPPPAALKGLVAHPGGFLAGFNGKRVSFSVPNQPHAWNGASVEVNYAVVALAVTGQTVVVLTEGDAVLLTGSSPDSLSKETMTNSQACASKRGVAKVGSSIVYVCPDGIAEAPSGALISESFYTRAQWQALAPTTMRLAYHDSTLFIVTASGMKLWRREGGGAELTETADIATGIYVNLLTDTLYATIGGQILPWAGGAARTYTYRTKKAEGTRAWAPGAYRLTGEGSVTLKLYGNDVLAMTRVISPGNGQTLPVLPERIGWAAQVEGTAAVSRLVIAETMAGLK